MAGYTFNTYYEHSPVELVISTVEEFDNSPKGVFNKSWRVIKNNFVDKTYNHQNWQKWKTRYEQEIKTYQDSKVAIDTMLLSLNDPYTRFLTKDNFEEQDRNIDSRLQGIGVHITEVDGNIVIASVMDDTPAQKYGLKEKDKIIKVDSVSTKGMSLKDVADIIRGEKDTPVVLTILRGNQTLTKNIIREEIKIKTVKYEMLNNNIAYIRITTFISSDTSNEFKNALLATSKADGLIVDVRGNYGGLLTNAVYISNMLIKDGNIVSIINRNNQKQNFDTTPGDFITDKPLVVLIDGSSASASEIFSGAIKDHNRGILVGEKTYGKGKVQMIYKLPDGSGINFTIAKYLTPSGTDIDHKGIEPDYVVENKDYDRLDKENDIQLNKAKEILLKQLT